MKVVLKGFETTQRSLLTKAESITQAKKKTITNDIVRKLKDATPVDTGEARDGWKTESGNIVNNVEHIGSLNHGSSQQAPSFFVEKTILSDNRVSQNGVIVTYPER